MLTIVNLLQLIGGLILTFGYIPQITKILKTKSVRDFSLVYLGSIFTGILFMEIYAVYMYFVVHAAGMFFTTNTICLCLAATEFFLVLYYYNKK
jgi:MtN3 and saliva related transmembrane protein